MKPVHTANISREFSAAELTRWAKETFAKSGVRLNRVNNIPIRRRKGTIEIGWSDLQGYSEIGIYVAVEVKKIGDKLSKAQIERLNDIIDCGALAFICTQQGDKPILKKWTKMES